MCHIVIKSVRGENAAIHSLYDTSLVRKRHESRISFPRRFQCDVSKYVT
jgi:hypothetical protein